MALIECVPNFSEGRDRTKVDAIVEAMRVDGVYLLDREMDVDHNRCVLTIAGDREAVMEAAIRGVCRAAELIDLTKHQGAHPRLGAADVVPFIPIEGVTLADCVTMARHVGEQIVQRCGVPVYFYEAAAIRPDRANLEDVRRGQFEGIREECLTNEARRPDLGGPQLHPTAGAVIVGARKFLVAYNVYLNTPDVEIAKKIGKAIRFSSGGLRYVKGMGVCVRGMAQVSMNLTDFEQTPIARVFEFVKREAARYGVQPVSSEIVGLIPKRALEDAAEWFLQIESFEPTMILENRMAAVMSGKVAPGGPSAGLRAGIEPFIEQLAAPTAAPGGGSASAAAGAMAAALGSMVAGMSRGKKAYVQHEKHLSEAIAKLELLRQELKAAIDADAQAFTAIMQAHRAQREGKGSHEQLHEATRHGIEIPLRVAEQADEIRSILASLRPITNPNMASDLTTGEALARAAAKGAIANVEINAESFNDETFRAVYRARAAELKERNA